MKIPILSNWIEKQTLEKLKQQDVCLKKFFEEARDVVLGNEELFNAMAKQRILLLKQKRKPIAIFVNEEVLKEVFLKVKTQIPTLWQKRILDGRAPITDVAKIFIYVNPLLTEAVLLVVGSIVWRSEVNNGK